MLTVEHLEAILWACPTTLEEVQEDLDLTPLEDEICPFEPQLENDGISRGYGKRG